MITITLFQQGGMWVADMDGALEVLGETTISTPFKASYPAAHVLATIQRLNPGDIVVLRREPATDYAERTGFDQ